MPSFSVPTTVLESPQGLPEGVYNLRLDKITYKPTKNKDSVNMRLDFEVVDGEHQGEKQSQFISSKAGWLQNDMCHALGFEMEPDGQGALKMPGIINGAEGIDQAESWSYVGPLVGAIIPGVQVVIVENAGKKYSRIKFLPCQVQGCAQKFPDLRHTADWSK